MLSDEKILITGPAGQIGFGVCEALAKDNDVWGVARFRRPAQRDEVEALGVTTRRIDLGTADFGDLPSDFTYLLHFAAKIDGDTYDRAIEVNAQGTGFVLQHCRAAKAALIVSTNAVYKPHPDPWHAFGEDDPLGDVELGLAPSYSVSKIAEEAVARYCARSFDLPVTIARMNAAYGPRGGVPTYNLHAVAAGETVSVGPEPHPYSPIHEDDVVEHIEPLLDAASVPATIVNWGGDEPVAQQEWTRYAGELLGVTPTMVEDFPWKAMGQVADNTKRLAITGLCKVSWREGVRRAAEAFYPDRVA